MNEIEDAILKFLTAVKKNSNTETPSDTVSLAAEIAINDYSSSEKIDVLCLKGEETFQKLMQTSENVDVLKWLWIVWRNKVGPSQKIPYTQLIEIENRAAKRNGNQKI